MAIRISHPPPSWYKTGNADSRRLPFISGYQHPQQRVFVAIDVDRIIRDLDMLVENLTIVEDGIDDRRRRLAPLFLQCEVGIESWIEYIHDSMPTLI